MSASKACESLEEYVNRVGSAFAIALLNDEAMRWRKKLDHNHRAVRAISYLIDGLEDNMDPDDDLGDELEMMASARQVELQEKIDDLVQRIKAIKSLKPVMGSGTQEQLAEMLVGVHVPNLEYDHARLVEQWTYHYGS